MKKVNFYIDGFNFYYGIKDISKFMPDWRKFYWIDFVLLFSQFLKEDEELGEIKLFTAKPKNIGKQKRQQLLLKANKRLNDEKLKIIYGKYIDKPMICRSQNGCGKTYMHWEEKQTDVNLAIKMIEDIYTNQCNKVVLVSGDSDFVPPLKLIKEHHPLIETLVLFPPTKSSHELSQGYNHIFLDRHKPKWNKSVMPDEFFAGTDKFVKPEGWNVVKKVQNLQ